MHVRHLPVPMLLGIAVLLNSPAFAHDSAAGRESITPLQAQPLPDASGKQGLMAMVSFAPGQASAPHVHSGSIFAYVLEGEVVSQLAGQPAITYKQGESWYEAPRTPHLVARNASGTKSARLLVWALVDQGSPIREPLSK